MYAPLFSKTSNVLSTLATVSLYSLAGVLWLPKLAAFFPAVLPGAFLMSVFLTATFFEAGLTRFDALVSSPIALVLVSLFYAAAALSALLRVVRVVVKSGIKNEALLAGGMMAGSEWSKQ